MNHFNASVIWAVCLYLFTSQPAFCQMAEPAALFVPAEASFRGPPSIEFRYRYDSNYHPAGVRPMRKGYVAEIRYDRPYYWFKKEWFNVSNISGSTNRQNAVSYAFNGITYQMLDHDDLGRGFLWITKQADRMSKEPSPLLPMIVPYLFVSYPHGSFLHLEEFMKSELWVDVAKRTKLMGKGNVDNLATVVVEVEMKGGSGKSVIYTVDLARDLDFYPLRWKIRASGHSNAFEGKVEKYVLREHLGKKIVIPLVIRETDLPADGKSTESEETYTIDEKTLRVGESIPRATFTISVPKSFSIFDADANLEIRSASRLPPKSALPLPQP